MRACVVGFGSVGRRHAEVLTRLGATVSIVTRTQKPPFPTFRSLPDAVRELQPEYFIVATETSDHVRCLLELEHYATDARVLVEKPLARTPAEAAAVVKRSAINVGYNLRFLACLQAVEKLLEGQHLISLDVHCGSYLPNWREGRDYRSGASAGRHGGGVLRDLSHEIDCATRIAGPWTSIGGVAGKFSTLEIESEDTAVLVAGGPRCSLACLRLSYCEHAPRRMLRAVTEHVTVDCDLLTGNVDATYKGGPAQHFRYGMQIADTYSAMHRAVLEGEGKERLCTFDEGVAVLDFIAAAEAKIGERSVVVL